MVIIRFNKTLFVRRTDSVRTIINEIIGKYVFNGYREIDSSNRA